MTDDMHLRASFAGSALYQPSLKNLAIDNEPEEKPSPDTISETIVGNKEDSTSITAVTALTEVLQEIDKCQKEKRQTGLSELNFTTGVLNVLIVAYIFGSFPEHFWIVFVAECIFFLPYKFRNMYYQKPLNGILYFLDFCWVMNFLGIYFLFLFFVSASPNHQYSMIASTTFDVDTLRRQVFMAAFGIACGPLLGATALLPFVAFVFHDVNTMSNLVIHIMPPMLLYTLRWHSTEIQTAYPKLFRLDYLDQMSFFPSNEGGGSIAGNSILVYIVWYIPYISWMVLIGMDLPRRSTRKNNNNNNGEKVPKFDTVFHSLWRSGPCETFGSIFWKRPVEISRRQMQMDDYETRDLLLYMAIHAVLVTISIFTLAYICSWNPVSHGILILLVTSICVYRGAQRYTYYTTAMYGKIVRKHLEAEFGIVNS